MYILENPPFRNGNKKKKSGRYSPSVNRPFNHLFSLTFVSGYFIYPFMNPFFFDYSTGDFMKKVPTHGIIRFIILIIPCTHSYLCPQG